MKVSVMACHSTAKKVDVLLARGGKDVQPSPAGAIRLNARVRKPEEIADDVALQPEDLQQIFDSADVSADDENDALESAYGFDYGFEAPDDEAMSEEAAEPVEISEPADEVFDAADLLDSIADDVADSAGDTLGYSFDDDIEENFGDYSRDEYFSRVETGNYNNAELTAHDLMNECFAQVSAADDVEEAAQPELDSDDVMSPMISITRYIDRDGKGGKVEVAPEDESEGKEVICLDGNGKLSRVCGYLKRGGSQE